MVDIYLFVTIVAWIFFGLGIISLVLRTIAVGVLVAALEQNGPGQLKSAFQKMSFRPLFPVLSIAWLISYYCF